MRIDWDDYAISPKMWNSFDYYYGDKSYREADWVEAFVQTVRDESARELEKLLSLYGPHDPEANGLQVAIDSLRQTTKLGDGFVWAYGEPLTEEEYREKYGKED